MRQILGHALVSALALALWGSSGCGSDAVGVDDCRRIETARCSAAQACGVLGDVEGCRRFYRDQCLHGLSVPSPGAADVEACARAIGAAESCARESDAACTDDAAAKELACDIVRHPELAPECAFLGASSRPGSGGSGSGEGSGTAGAPASSPSAGDGGAFISSE